MAIAVVQETTNFSVNKDLGKKPSIHSSNWQKQSHSQDIWERQLPHQQKTPLHILETICDCHKARSNSY